MPQIWPAVTFDTIDIDDKDGIEGEAEQDHKKWFFEMLWGLQNKTEFFYELHRIAADLNINFKPKQIVSDFERTIFLAAKEYFPETHFQGCLFHFGQNIWRQVQKSKLAAKYGRRNAIIWWKYIIGILTFWKIYFLEFCLWNFVFGILS